MTRANIVRQDDFYAKRAKSGRWIVYNKSHVEIKRCRTKGTAIDWMKKEAKWKLTYIGNHFVKELFNHWHVFKLPSRKHETAFRTRDEAIKWMTEQATKIIASKSVEIDLGDMNAVR